MSHNQCDGCNAGRPLKKNRDGSGYYHVMGSKEPGRYPDLMSCEAPRYGFTIGEKTGTVYAANCSKCGERKVVCCDSGVQFSGEFSLHEAPVCKDCCEPHPKVIDGLDGQERA